jgi:hypothetical protein
VSTGDHTYTQQHTDTHSAGTLTVQRSASSCVMAGSSPGFCPPACRHDTDTDVSTARESCDTSVHAHTHLPPPARVRACRRAPKNVHRHQSSIHTHRSDTHTHTSTTYTHRTHLVRIDRVVAGRRRRRLAARCVRIALDTCTNAYTMHAQHPPPPTHSALTAMPAPTLTQPPPQPQAR